MARPTKNKKESKKKGRYFAIEIYPESMPIDWENIIEKTSIPCVLSPLHNRDGWWLDSDFVKDHDGEQIESQEDLEKYIFNEKNICVIEPDELLKGADTAYTDSKGNIYNVFYTNQGAKIQKKPHYHLLMAFGSPVSANRAIDLSVALGGNGYAEFLNYPKAYYEYLTHKNEPNKAQYLESDLRFFSNFAWYKNLPLPDYDILSEWREAIESLIDERSICNLIDLKKHLRELAKNNIRPELFYYVDTHPAEWDRLCRANYTAIDIQHRYRKEIDELKEENKELKYKLERIENGR